MIDALCNVRIKDFIYIGKLNPNTKQAGKKVWKPEREIYLIGARCLLLNCTCNMVELYCAVSEDGYLPEQDDEFYHRIKTGNIFFFQRDQRFPPIGQADLGQTFFFPAGYGYYVNMGTPIYIKWVAISRVERRIAYDIILYLYYVEIRSALNLPPLKYEPLIPMANETCVDGKTSRIIKSRI